MSQAEQDRATLSRLERVDDLCLRYEDEWQAGKRPEPAGYLAGLSDADAAAALGELLLLEWDYRRKAGESFYRDEYVRRFEAQADAVERAWERWKEREQSAWTMEAPSPGESRPAWAERAAPPLPPGYERPQLIGQGGMGEVWKARDPQLNRWVALKLVRLDQATPQGLSRFRAEAKILAQLQHPHIVRVYGFNENNGQPLLEMEYVGHGSLEDRLGRLPLPAEDTRRLLAILAWAVHAAHEKGIVHRDLKPQNVLIDAPVDGNPGTVLGGFPKVSDFGLATLADAVTGRTLSGDMVGTPAYMSPEQAAGKTREVGRATDVWALGVILYRCLTGVSPFAGDSVLDTIERVKTLQYRPVREQCPGVAEDLAAVCEACMRPAAADRPSARRVAEWLDGPPALLPVGSGGGPGGVVSEPAPPISRGKSLRWLAWPLGGAALLAGLLVWVLVSGQDRRQEPGGGSAVRVVSFEVEHWEQEGGKDHVIGPIGVTSFKTFVDDRVVIRVELAEPAWCYLIGYNFNGQEQLLWPCDERHPERPGRPDQPPGRVRQLQYPPPPPRDAKGEMAKQGGLDLSDDRQGGLQAFLVVVGRQPLPAFADWKQGRGEAPWKKVPAGREVWRSDGATLDPVLPGEGRKRGKVKALQGQPPLLELCRWAEGEGTAAEAIAFGVHPREGR